jgi:hypothetical protein
MVYNLWRTVRGEVRKGEMPVAAVIPAAAE